MDGWMDGWIWNSQWNWHLFNSVDTDGQCLEPGHQLPQWGVCNHAFPAIYGLTHCGRDLPTLSVTASVMAVIVIGYFSLLIYCNGYVYDKPKFRLVARSSVTWRWDSSALSGLYLRLESGPFRLVTLCDVGHELRKAGSDSVSFQSCPSMRYFGSILLINSM